MLNRWNWLCPWPVILLAAGVLAVFGLNRWNTLFAVVFLFCPVLLWGLCMIRYGRVSKPDCSFVMLR
ncbi:MAG: hypothetical protein AB1720_10695 [Pseudomonadota bacterium]